MSFDIYLNANKVAYMITGWLFTWIAQPPRAAQKHLPLIVRNTGQYRPLAVTRGLNFHPLRQQAWTCCWGSWLMILASHLWLTFCSVLSPPSWARKGQTNSSSLKLIEEKCEQPNSPCSHTWTPQKTTNWSFVLYKSKQLKWNDT